MHAQSCILNWASCYFGDWHRWSLERTILHALYLVISRNAMVSFLCQDACKEKIFYSLASWSSRRDCEGRGGRVCSFPLQKFGFGILGKKHAGVPPREEAAAIKAKTEECNGLSQAELVSLWGRAAGCWLCSGSMVRHSLEIQKHRAHWKFLMKVFFNRKYWDCLSDSFCEKWLLALGNVVFH